MISRRDEWTFHLVTRLGRTAFRMRAGSEVTGDQGGVLLRTQTRSHRRRVLALLARRSRSDRRAHSRPAPARAEPGDSRPARRARARLPRDGGALVRRRRGAAARPGERRVARRHRRRGPFHRSQPDGVLPERGTNRMSDAIPSPLISIALGPRTPEDRLRLGRGLTRIMGEDPRLVVETDPETSEVVVFGMTEEHLEIVLHRLGREFKVDALVGRPQVAYKETVTCVGRGEMKYARQIDGRGQYAHVKLYVHP